MLVLGVDPGLAATGYGLIKRQAENLRLVEGGVIRSNASDPVEKRVGAIFSGIAEVIDEFKPDIMAIEDLYSHYKHPKTAVIMAHARGAILAAADIKNVAVVNYAATKIKSALTGNGRARKEQVQQMVLDSLNIKDPIEPLDTTDALAAALCYFNQQRWAVSS